MTIAKILTLVIAVFLLGWLSNTFYAELTPVHAEPFTKTIAEPIKQAQPQSNVPVQKVEIAAEPVSVKPQFEREIGGREQPSPSDRLQLSNVHVTGNRVTIDGIPNHQFETAVFTDTNSMDPLIDDGSQAIQIVPLSTDEIRVGDIISYDSGQWGIIIHRVIQIGNDSEGWYAVVKGDNNPTPDPFKVRFKMIKRVLVGVLY